jgi:hypothetical protein
MLAYSPPPDIERRLRAIFMFIFAAIFTPAAASRRFR